MLLTTRQKQVSGITYCHVCIVHYRLLLLLLLSKPLLVTASVMPAKAAFPGQSWVIMQYFLWEQYRYVDVLFISTS